VGLVISAVAWTLWPHRYMSTALVSFHFKAPQDADEPSKQKVRDFMSNLRATAFSDQNLQRIASRESVDLETIVKRFNVRKVDRSRHPDYLKQFSSIECCWETSFTAGDPKMAQNVTAGLIGAHIDYVYAHHLFPYPDYCLKFDECRGSNFQLLEIASVGRDLKPPLWQFAMTGVAIGAVLSLFIRVYPRPNR
jgi:hypothetical protein